MKHRKLGKTNLQISLVTLGTGSVAREGGYSFGVNNTSTLQKLLECAAHHQINHIDMAPIYGFRYIESEFGKLPKSLTSKFYVSSKGGLTFSGRKKVRIDNSPAMLGSMLNETLKSLNSDYVDFYFLHWPDDKVPLEESLNFLEKQKKAGKIRFIGLSNYEISKIDQTDLRRIDVIQNEHHFLVDKASSAQFDLAANLDLGVLVYGLFGKGALVGKNFETLENNDYRKDPKLLEKLLKLQRDVSSHKDQITQCLSVLKNKNIHSGIIGFRNLHQLESVTNLLP